MPTTHVRRGSVSANLTRAGLGTLTWSQASPEGGRLPHRDLLHPIGSQPAKTSGL